MFEKSEEIAGARTDDLMSLFMISNGNPKTFFVGADLSYIDLSSVDLSEFNISGSIINYTAIDGSTRIRVPEGFFPIHVKILYFLEEGISELLYEIFSHLSPFGEMEPRIFEGFSVNMRESIANKIDSVLIGKYKLNGSMNYMDLVEIFIDDIFNFREIIRLNKLYLFNGIMMSDDIESDVVVDYFDFLKNSIKEMVYSYSNLVEEYFLEFHKKECIDGLTCVEFSDSFIDDFDFSGMLHMSLALSMKKTALRLVRY